MILFLATAASVILVPLLSVGAAVALDRWSGRDPLRLEAAAAAITAVASALILVLPLAAEPVRRDGVIVGEVRQSVLRTGGLESLALAAVPVLIACVPLLIEAAARRQFAVPPRGLMTALRSLAALGLAAVSAAAITSLVGLFYLPAAAVLAAAALRGARPRTARAPAPMGSRNF